MSVRIVQITDTHLFQDPDGVLAGVRTWKTFRAVLELIERRHGDFDYLILTGDLAQDERLETYLMLREALGDWLGRCRIIPGNHDAPGNLRAAFPELLPQGDGPLTFALTVGGWSIIGLDSHVPGDPRGRIGVNQLRWLEEQLARARSTPALLFVHHPPVSIKSDPLAEVEFHEPATLIELIEAWPQIRAICAGHVHQEYAGFVGTAAMYTTPSTCVRFGARDRGTFDTTEAGYRIFRLDEDCHTEVHRLSPDWQSVGRA